MPVSLTRRRGDTTPTQNSGFAATASQSAYPDTWRELVLAYEPGLGRDVFRDYSGAGNTMTFEGGMTIAADFVTTQSYANAGAPPGFALDFDGVDDALNWGSRAVTHDPFDGGATLCLWAYAAGDGSSGTPRLFEKGRNIAPTSRWSMYRGNTSSQVKFLYDHTGTTGVWFTGTNTFPLNTWVHVGLTYKNSAVTNDPRIWINGDEVTVTTQTAPTGTRESDVLDDIRLGNTQGGLRPFDGGIGGARLYRRELSDAEMRQQYEIPLAPYILGRRYWQIPAVVGGGRIMSSLVGAGGLAAEGGLAGRGGGLAA